MREDPEQITYFAQTNARGKEVPFGIKRRDRARHMYVIGKTGVGKSTLLENMAIQDIRNGEGMAFIDPHGSTAERLLEYVPEHRINDVVYFAPFDMDHPVAFNVMEDVGYDKRHLVVSGLITAFKKLWVDAFSARMEYILSNTLLALLEYPDATMLDVNRMLVEKNFRKKVVENISDPIVKKFWTEEFANYTDRYTQEATPAIQNKVGQFTSNPLIRNIIGQPKSSFDIRQLMDDKKIFIINLSKGRVGEVNASLLGSMLVTKIYLAAMSRADVPSNILANLPNFYFYVDEFQNFANQSFADILSEARKYKLNLIIAHQYVEQMEEEVRDAVFGNVGTTIAFRVGPFDAEVLETIFAPQFSKQDLVNLGIAQVYLTLMIDGTGSPPFSATTLPPFDAPPQRFVGQVITASRTQFARPRADVEKAIELWQGSEAAQPAPAPAEKRSSPGGQSRHDGGVSSVRRIAPEGRHTSVKEQAPAESHRPLEVVRPAAKEVPRQSERRGEHTPRRAVENEPAIDAHAPPPIAGAKSLREALEHATKKHVPPSTAPTKSIKDESSVARTAHSGGMHAPDLRETLRAIIAETPPVSGTKTAQLHEQTAEPRRPAGLAEQALQDLLRVDEPDEPTS